MIASLDPRVFIQQWKVPEYKEILHLPKGPQQLTSGVQEELKWIVFLPLTRFHVGGVNYRNKAS